MKRNIQIYVEGVKLDLFDDENIEVNSTITKHTRYKQSIF